MSITYKDSGVDISAGDALVDRIKPLARATLRPGVNGELGGFGGLFDLAACTFNDPVLVAANDGVGTKLKIAFEVNKHDTVGIDLVAMCVNDLVVQGAEPLFFLDYFATGGLEGDTAYQVIEGISQGCLQAGAALIGGETAEMPGMYAPKHYDLAGFAVGAVERDKVLPSRNIVQNDVVIGIASNGLHSNGFSLVRHLVDKHKLSYTEPAAFDSSITLGEALLSPTRIYVKPVLELLKTHTIKGLVHITGGGFIENIPRILPSHLAIEIDCRAWDPHPVFGWLSSLGKINSNEMLRTFNCGIGMLVIVKNEEANTVLKKLTELDQHASVIGQVQTRKQSAVSFIEQERLYEKT